MNTGSIEELLDALERDISARRFAVRALASFQRMGESAVQQGFANQAELQSRNARIEREKLDQIDAEIGRLCRRIGEMIG